MKHYSSFVNSVKLKNTQINLQKEQGIIENKVLIGILIIMNIKQKKTKIL